MSIKPTNIPKYHLRKSADSAGNISRHCKLGELTENIRTFALPFESKTYSFKMQYEYDSWNRIQIITYPDGEKVSYDYNRGGMLCRVAGQKDGRSYRYIDSIRYTEFELKDAVWYGNGARATYDYDVLQRLSHLRSYDGHDSLMQDLSYTFDSVGNITNIANSAPMLPNGLGGTYSLSFSYDNLYRLTGSTGTWAGASTLNYQTTARYHANGRILKKNLAVRRLLNGTSDTVNYSHRYYYENASQPNTLTRYSSSVWNPDSWISVSTEEDSQFSWDAMGNMTVSCIGGTQDCRQLCWNEQDRLTGVRDDKYLSYYQYDANGDRTYKLTGKGELQNISGNWHYYYLLDNATLYASPYLVATERGYTKHYYAESERIASKIGGGGLSDFSHSLLRGTVSDKKVEANSDMMDDVFRDCLGAKYYEVHFTLGNLYDWCDSVQPETECYWYHPDHLGSSSWITYSDGKAVQHLHYLPWGEDFVNQRASSFSSIYTFSAKERDPETGLSYFGSRYYSSDLSIWLSVDPMSDKYPSLSPYVYCADNPVKLVDPNGEDWYENELTGDVYYSRDYRKGDEKKLKGKGWKWMGGNNMFGRSADDAITANLDKADVYTQDDSYGRVGFSGNNAKEFMSNMGYKEVPTQVVTYDNTYSYSMSDGKHTFRFTLGGQYDYTETSTYVPNNYSESHRRQIGYSTFGSKDPMSGQMPQVSRYAVSYSKSPDFPGVRKFLCALAGRHDYTDHFNCGRLSSAKLSGTQGSLIRKFLSQH